MTPMGTANRGNLAGMAGMGEPVVDCGANLAPLDWGRARTRVAGNQQYYTIAGRNRRLDPVIYRTPGPVEIMTVQVERAVWDNRATLQAAVPRPVEPTRTDNFARHDCSGRWTDRRYPSLNFYYFRRPGGRLRD